MSLKKLYYPSLVFRIFLFTSIILSFSSNIFAQDNSWNNKKCAVVLTYDDALNVHLDNVVPLLDSLDFKATFYLSGYFPGFRERAAEWNEVAKKGNELGNHTLFHPCEGSAPGREWVNPNYDLSTYTMQRLLDEIKMANVLFNIIDGKNIRTFAYPCADTKAGDSSYIDNIKSDFIAARNVYSKMQKINEIDLFNIPSYMINGQSGDELVELVQQAMNSNSLLVFLFHGVGGEHSLNVSLDAHSQLLHFLKENEKDIWIPTMVEASQYVKEHQTKTN